MKWVREFYRTGRFYNMIYVFEQGSVVYDGTTISDELKAQAVVVKELPKKETPQGHKAILRADKSTETVYWEYIEDDEITKLNKLLDDAISLLEEVEVL